MENPPISPEKDLQKKLAGKWEEDLERGLKEVLSRENKNLDEVVDVIWEKGILDRVVPKEEAVRLARKELGKFVLDLDREDPELYWRIFYGLLSYKEAEKHSFSLVPDQISAAVQRGFFSINPEDASKYFQTKTRNYYPEFIDKFLEKAERELEKRG